MWKGEAEAPPLPKVAESPYKDPSTFKSPTMNHELEQLRKRGLTKKLSKHFTQEAETIAEWKAQADRALRELEERKAKAANSATPSSQQELGLLDSMYTKVLKFKKETQRKEEESLLLYQRALKKYGNIKLVTPDRLSTPAKGSNAASGRSSPIASAPVSELAEAFEKAANEHGVPEFLLSASGCASAFNKEELEEILEESCLPDPEGTVVRCESPKACGSTSITAVESDDYEDGDDDDLSQLSVLTGTTTLNSAMTREVLQDAANQAKCFIKSNAEEIKKMVQHEEEASITASYFGSIAEDSEKASEAEDMVQRMKQILAEFEKENSETPTVTGLSEDSSTSVCESATIISTEAPAILAPTHFNHEDFKPEARISRQSTRIEMYRAKRRKQRKRRTIAFLSVVTPMSFALAYYKYTHPNVALFELAPQGTVDRLSNLIDQVNKAQTFVQIPKEAIFPSSAKEEEIPKVRAVKTKPAPKKPATNPAIESNNLASHHVDQKYSIPVEEIKPLKLEPKEAVLENVVSVHEQPTTKEAEPTIIPKSKEVEGANVGNTASEVKVEEKTFANHLVQVLAGPLYISTEYYENRKMWAMN